MSVPVATRAATNGQQYRVNRMLTSAGDPLSKNGVRFKKVGNLMTLDTSYQGQAPRVNSLGKNGNQNLFLKNVFNE